MRKRLSNRLDIYADYLVGFWCPGCSCRHSLYIYHPKNKDYYWTWNGDVNNPTFHPSLKVTQPWLPLGGICHTFIRDGKIEYLMDCWHDLKGTTIDMVDIPVDPPEE